MQNQRPPGDGGDGLPGEVIAGGTEAAFVIAITVGGAMRIEPIEVMTFNGEGLITSMKAYWGPANITQL